MVNKSSMRKIGTNQFNYPQLRNFVSLKYNNYSFVIVKDIFNLCTNIIFKFTKRIYAPFQFLFFTIKGNQVALYHLFNVICFVNKPWIVTFETSLPRLGNAPKWLYTIAVKRLAHNSCKKIIAMSECTAQIQKDYLQKYYPNLADKILQKMIVLHPAQSMVVTSSENKNFGGDLVFTLIGSDFFRKGGKEVINVFDNLFKQGIPVHLNIVSSLDYGDYASHATIEDYYKALEVIQNHKNNITHYKRLDNDQVLELLKHSHIGLLPTYADSYGYSVLEAQAAGCPVITTNVRALPEINNEECGWLIDVPKRVDGNAKLDTPEERANLSSMIEYRLMEIILSIVLDRTVLKKKSELVLNRIKVNHNPSIVAKKLAAIYDAAV